MNIDGQALKFRKGLLEICDLVQRLAQYPDDFHLLFRFVTLPQVITRHDDVSQTTSSTPAAATLARKSSLGSLSQQQCALFQQQEEAILRNGCSNLLILAQRLRIASVEQLRGAMALGSRTELTRSDLNSAESLFAGVEWDVTKAVVQIYLLRDLIFWYSSIETLFRIVPDNSNVLAAGTFSLVSPEQHQASLEILSAFLKEHCNVDWENLRKNVWEQGGSTSGSRMEYLVRVLALPQSQIQVYGPLLSFLSLSPKEMANVRDSLVMLCSVQMFQVSRLRTLSEIEIYELKSLLGIDLFNQQQQQQQQQIPPLKQAKMVINNASTNDISAAPSTFLSFNDTQQQQIPQSLQSQPQIPQSLQPQQQSQQIPQSLQSQQQPQQQFVMEPLQRNMISQTLSQGIQQTEPEINTILPPPPPQLPSQTLQPQQSTTPPPATTAQTSQSMIDIIQQQQQQQPQQQSQLQLTIIEQPPERCVYKRNIKPGPTVVVSGGTTNDLTSLAVAILLYRCDTNTNESRNLSGHTPIDVTPSRVVVFRRLKILSTSHQLSETLFVLRFELRRYHNGPIGVGDYEVLNVATSTPINVVSHSTQLRTLSATSVPSPMSSSGSSNSATNQQNGGDQQDSAQGIGAGKRPHEAVGAVTVSEIIPASGACRGGTRVAILGSNFSNSPGMRVLFGNVEVVPTFYAQGTITCVTPEHSPGVVPVRVCNIPKCWSDSSVSFTYEDTPRTLRGVAQQSSQFAGQPTTTATIKPQGVEQPQQQQQHPIGVNPNNNTNDSSNDVIIDNASNSANNLSTSMEVEKTNPLSPTVTMQVQSQQEMSSSPQRGGVTNNVQSTNLSKDLLLPSPKTFADSNMTLSNVSTPSTTMLPTSSTISTSSPQSLSSPAITTTTIGTIHPSQQQPSPSSMLPMQLISPHTITPPNNVNSNVCTCGCNCKNTSNISNTLTQNNNNIINNNTNVNNNLNFNNNTNVNNNNNNNNVNNNINNTNVNINSNRVINEETEAIIKRISSGDFDGLCQMRLSRTGVNSLDSRGFAPLHYIATAPSVPRNAIDTLIQAGGDINIRDEYANTPIHWAAMAGNPACISNLLALGADPSAQNYDGETPLHVAASIHLQTSVQCCRALIAAGASPNVTENSRCETPLHRAAAENNADIITVLIEAGALAAARDEDSYTPLHVAVMAAAGAAVKVLLEKGRADPNAVSGDGETPLQMAEAAGNQEIRAMLLAAGARVAETVVTTAPARPRTRSNPVEMKRPFGVDRQVPSYLSPVKNCNDVNMTSSNITTSSTPT